MKKIKLSIIALLIIIGNNVIAQDSLKTITVKEIWTDYKHEEM